MNNYKAYPALTDRVLDIAIETPFSFQQLAEFKYMFNLTDYGLHEAAHMFWELARAIRKSPSHLMAVLYNFRREQLFLEKGRETAKLIIQLAEDFCASLGNSNEDGFASVNEQGQEFVVGPNGKVKFDIHAPTISRLPRGAWVAPHHRAIKRARGNL